METKGLFKRIAAITMAALTIVTSSGVDVNLLTANANELTKQATENAVDENTNKALQKKDANVGAQEKLSFSTNEALKRAVDDAGFNINVKTNKVISAAIKYNQSLLTLGEDFTATAKRTDYKQNSSNYNYVYTVTVTGKGKYTGTAKKTGVTVVSTTKPKTTNKKVKKAGEAVKRVDGFVVEAITTTSGTDVSQISNAISSDNKLQETHGWAVQFDDDTATLVSGEKKDAQGKNHTIQRITYFDYGTRNKAFYQSDDGEVMPHISKLTYNGVEVKTGDMTRNDANYTSDGYGPQGRQIRIQTNLGWQYRYIKNNTDKDKKYMGGIVITYETEKSAVEQSGQIVSLRDGSDSSTEAHKVGYDSEIGYFASPSFTYNGNKITPTVWVDMDNGTHIQGTGSTSDEAIDVKDVYYDLQVKLPEAFHNQKFSVMYRIAPKTLTEAMVPQSPVSNLTYTGKKQMPKFNITDSEVPESRKQLKQSEGNVPDTDDDYKDYKSGDYYITYDSGSDGIKTGEQHVTIHGTGNYTGEVHRTITIGGKASGDVTVEQIPDQTYNGKPIEPKVTVKDDDTPLTEGTDYDTLTSDSYHNNVIAATGNSNKITYPTNKDNPEKGPYVEIHLKGNYSGTIYQPFTIKKGDISQTGNKVYLYDGSGNASSDTAGWKLAGTLADLPAGSKDGGVKTVTATNGVAMFYNPTNGKPQIRIEEPNGHVLTSDDFDLESNTPTLANRTWCDVADSWTATIKGKGSNYDSTNTFKLVFNVVKTPLNNSHIKVTSTDLNNSAGPQATLVYTADNGTTDTLKQGTDYTVSVDGNSSGAGANVTISATSTGKFIGSTSAKGQMGYDLSKVNQPGSKLTLTMYDPFTGKKLDMDNNEYMPYYGDSITPHFIVQNATVSGSFYTENKSDFTVSDVTREQINSSSSDKSTWTVTAKLTGSSDHLYNSYTVTYKETQLDLSDNTDVKTDSDGLYIVTPDNNSLTTYTDPATIQSQVKLYVKPKKAGESVQAQNGSTTIDTWNAPNIWTTGTDQYGNLLTGGQDFTLRTLDKRELNTQNKTVIAHGIGHYKGTYTIHLDQVDIGTSKDYEMVPDPNEKVYDWNGEPLFPKVRLSNKSTGDPVAPENYYVIYSSNNDGSRYVLSYVNGEPSDQFEVKLDSTNQKVVANTTASGSNAITDSGSIITITDSDGNREQQDPTVKTLNKEGNAVQITKNKISSFKEEGTYTVYIKMKSSEDGNTTKLSGETGKATYTIKKQSVNDKIDVGFTPRDTVDYKGFGENDKALTPEPILSSSDGTTTTNGQIKLYVRDKEGNDLETSKYTVNSAQGKGNPIFTYPGKKTVTVIGKGEYAGRSEVSYTVKGDLSKLADKKYFTVTGLPLEELKENNTVYTDGSSAGGTSKFKTAKGTSFSLDDFSITIPQANVELKRGVDYTVSPEIISTTGEDIPVVIQGISEGYIGTSYVLHLHVVESRSGLKWNNGENSTELTVPYTGTGYELGTGRLSILSNFSGRTVNLTPVSITNSTSSGSAATSSNTNGDAISIAVSDGGVSPLEEGNTSVRPTFTEVGTYAITISGPTSTSQSTTLILHIRYDLSQAKVSLGFIPNGGSSIAYSGTAPYDPDKVTVKIGTRTLDYNKDYTLDPGSPIPKDAGSYTVKVGNTPRSMNTISEPYTILPLSVSGKMHAADLTETLTYNGKEQDIPDSAFDGKVTYDNIAGSLKYGTDYEVAYLDGKTNAGKWRYQVTGKGNYSGSSAIGYFTIEPHDLSKDDKNNFTIPTQYYAGKGVKVVPQEISLAGFTDPLTILSGNTGDYQVINQEDNDKVSAGNSEAKITIEGTGNFKGKKDLTYPIVRLDIKDARVVTTTGLTYTGNEYKPNDYVRVYIPVNGLTPLTYNTDYTVEVKWASDGSGRSKGNNTIAGDRIVNAGDYNIIIRAKAGSDLVTGTQTTDYPLHIEAMDISDNASEFSVADAEWTGEPVTPKVLRNNRELESDLYDVTYTKNTNACGTLEEMRTYDPAYSVAELPTATIIGRGNYKGTITKNFRIGHDFSRATVTVKGGRITYDGNTHEPEFTIAYGNKRVDVNKVVYETKYPSDTTNAGSKEVTLTATAGPLYGTKTFTYYIYPAAGSTWTVEFSENSGLSTDSSGMKTITYQGAAITPEVKAYLLGAGGTKTEIPLDSTEITYKDNNAAGTASVSISPKNYEGTKVLYFKILGVDLFSNNNIYVAFTDGVSRRKYTGAAIQPAVTVTYAGTQGTVTLTKDRDFSLTYENNTNAGAANVKITGIGNYTGSRTLDFSIFADLNDRTSTFTIPKQMYTGEPITELKGATIKAGGNNLKLGTDYTLDITSTDSFRTKGTAIFKAQGDYYEGTRTVQFDIGNDASMYNVLGVAANYVFDHQAHKPVPVVTDTEGTVYPVDSVSYASTSDGDSCVNAGNVRMQIAITSHGQTVSIPYNYTIERRNINTATFTPIADVDYNGKAHTPNVRVTEGTRLLTGTQTTSDGSADYAVTYYNNIQPGKALVTVTGINNYTGVSNIYFNINVKEAPQMKVTAMPSGRLKVSWTKVNGVSGYRIFYSPQGGSQKQVNIGSSKKTTYLTGLTRGVLYTVGLQSYVRANGQNGYSSASVQQIATSTTQPKITSAKSNGKGKIKLTWKKVSNATAYMVYRKTSGSKKWTRVKTTKSTSFTNTGLKSGRKYTYKVISYKQSGVKRSFSKYSKGKTVRAK